MIPTSVKCSPNNACGLCEAIYRATLEPTSPPDIIKGRSPTACFISCTKISAISSLLTPCWNLEKPNPGNEGIMTS